MTVGVARLLKLLVLFCLEKEGAPTGIFPLAFSDMPRSCRGTVSSAAEPTEAVRELLPDCAGERRCGVRLSSSSPESSSSPMLNALFSSGTLLNVGGRLEMGLLRLSIEFCREFPLVEPPPSLALRSFLSWF